MGFDPLGIPYLRMCHERGLGVGDPREIEIVGADVSDVNMGFQTRRSLAIWEWLWHPMIGRVRIRAFGETAWGRLFDGY